MKFLKLLTLFVGFLLFSFTCFSQRTIYASKIKMNGNTVNGISNSSNFNNAGDSLATQKAILDYVKGNQGIMYVNGTPIGMGVDGVFFYQDTAANPNVMYFYDVDNGFTQVGSGSGSGVSLSDQSIPFYLNGNAQESPFFKYDSLSGDLSIKHDLIAGQGDLNSITRYERGGDYYNDRAINFNVYVRHQIKRAGGSFASKTAVNPNSTLNGVLHVKDYEIYDGTNYNPAGMMQVRASKNDPNDSKVDWGFFTDSSVPLTLDNTNRIFGMSAINAKVSFDHFNRTTKLMTAPLLGASTSRKSIIPLFSDEGIMYEDTTIAFDAATKKLHVGEGLSMRSYDANTNIEYLAGGDINSYRALNFTAVMEHNYYKAGGSLASPTKVLTNATNGLMLDQNWKVYNGASYETAGQKRVWVTDSDINNEAIFTGWFDNSNTGSFNKTGLLFGFDGNTGLVELGNSYASNSNTEANTGKTVASYLGVANDGTILNTPITNGGNVTLDSIQSPNTLYRAVATDSEGIIIRAFASNERLFQIIGNSNYARHTLTTDNQTEVLQMNISKDGKGTILSSSQTGLDIVQNNNQRISFKTISSNVPGAIDRLVIDSTINFTDYGDGNRTGTLSYLLGVQTDGEVIDVDPSSIGAGLPALPAGVNANKLWLSGDQDWFYKKELVEPSDGEVVIGFNGTDSIYCMVFEGDITLDGSYVDIGTIPINANNVVIEGGIKAQGNNYHYPVAFNTNIRSRIEISTGTVQVFDNTLPSVGTPTKAHIVVTYEKT